MSVYVKDVPYRVSKGTELLARIYQPSDGDRLPAIVSVHGGGWNSGDRTTNTSLDAAMANAGFVVMAIDFRMPPEAMYPASIQDINCAICWLRDHAQGMRVDPRRIGGLGTSSGGHQIMLAALRPKMAKYRIEGADGDSSLAWIMICWGVLDPLARYKMACARGMSDFIKLHQAYWPDEAAMADGNPQLILERGEASDLPPALLIYGAEDDVLPKDTACRFADAYRRVGGDITVKVFPGEGHLFATKSPSSAAARDAIATMIGFSRELAGF
jgi:acetyl esterase